MKEQTTGVQLIVQKGSWLFNSCNPVPVFSALCYPTAVISHVEMLQRSNDGRSARAEKAEQNSE